MKTPMSVNNFAIILAYHTAASAMKAMNSIMMDFHVEVWKITNIRFIVMHLLG